MKDSIDKLEIKIDKLDTRLDEINTTLVVNTDHLAQHMARTALLEKRVQFIESHIYIVNALFKVGIGLAGFAAFVAALVQIVDFFKK